MYYLFIYDHLVSQWNVSSIQAETLSYPLHCPQSIQCVFSKHFKINNLLNCVCVCVCVCVQKLQKKLHNKWKVLASTGGWDALGRYEALQNAINIIHVAIIPSLCVAGTKVPWPEQTNTDNCELNTVLHSFIFTVSFSSHPNKTDLFSI